MMRKTRQLAHEGGGISGEDNRESLFQAQVERLARACGWLVYHTYRSERSEPGFPDLVMVRDDRLIFAELKLDLKRSQLSDEQSAWLQALSATPAEVYVWRPSGIETIRDILNRPHALERKPTYAELERKARLYDIEHASDDRSFDEIIVSMDEAPLAFVLETWAGECDSTVMRATLTPKEKRAEARRLFGDDR